MTARNHHFISECYLRGFTHGGQRQSKLTVLDRQRQCKPFSTRARNVGAERDFNRIDIDGLSIDALESAYANFEGELAPRLKAVDVARNLDDENNRIYILNLIALFAVRNPKFRSRMESVKRQEARIIGSMMVSSKEMWEQQVKGAQKSGFLPEKMKVTYEEMKKFIDDEAYDIEVPRENHILRETSLNQTVLECLIGRKWSVIESREGSGFITSDHPVCLRWITAPKTPNIYPPGYGVMGTEVVFPISKNVLAIGRFEGEAVKLSATPEVTAFFNSIIASHATTQIYAADDKFLYATYENTIGRGTGLMREPFFQPRNSSKRKPILS